MDNSSVESWNETAWRRPAPRARRLATALYGWREPGWVFLFAVIAAMPFILAAAFAGALLSLKPTVAMIAPIADARAIAGGAAPLASDQAPLYSLLLLAGDLFVDAPGRIHLIAKALAATLIAYPLAYLNAARFPAAQAVLMTAALAAYVAAPFAGPEEIALAVLLVTALALIGAPADEDVGRARFEGALAGGGLFILWMLNPVFSLAGFVALAACPFVTKRAGMTRYVIAAIAFVVLAVIAEIAAPGVNVARAAMASKIFLGGAARGSEATFALGGVIASTGVIIAVTAIFGGREHWKSWGSAIGLAFIAFGAARLAGANPSPVFIVAAALACFSVCSPFYDGVFRQHDRASISVALAAAGLTLFWTSAILAHSAGQFLLQQRVAREAPEPMRAELGLVQPGGPTIARWVEEGRFSTPEARELFALAPVDQSAMLLEAAARAREVANRGLDVAILTGSDAACVIAEKRACRANGEAAADSAKVVFVPRLDLDPATAAAKGKAEALLYTEFKLIGQTPLWEVWLRRGATLPADLAATIKPAS